MRDFWAGLPIWGQETLILIALLLPLALMAATLLRGLAPWPLALGMIRRFAWINAVFVALIAVSVGMGIGLIAQERGLRQGTADAASKFDLVVSAPGSEISMLLAAVYLRPADVPLIDGETFNAIADDDRVRLAAPIAFGDSFEGDPIVGTVAELVTHLSEGAIEGRVFATEEEAVVGALVDVPVGGEIEPAHGRGTAAEAGLHGGFHYEVVGRMAPTGSPWDRAILVPVEGVWAVHGLANGHPVEEADGHGDDADHDEDHGGDDEHGHDEAYEPSAGQRIGPPFEAALFPGTPAVIVVPEQLAQAYALQSAYTRDAETMAFLPGAVLSQLYAILGDIRQAMSLMSLVAQILVAASVLTGLVMLLRLFERHMALLRALGAPTRFLVALVWSYGAGLLVLGGVLGAALGWAVAGVLSDVVAARTGIAIPVSLGWAEIHLVAGFVTATACVALLAAWAVIHSTRASRVRM
ncbi:FtsX-like permease family protein [Palleronia pelagia]|uniref:Putative ABC transport system permease protein n=1 Tax=Palleronia pelagia TaxID=387096 RepID=A0A1H8HED6_9RHOB|nr:FtsX-like permease family protein [Palleronia pelagia]SEN54616.1 putative ABC transport system permease protein [Palleronia pelagia]